MRTTDSAHNAALGADARLHGLVERDLLWLRGQDSEGDPAEFAFWVGRVPVSITVNAGYDGGTATRSYLRGLIEVDDIPEGLGMGVRRVQVVLNHSVPRVRTMLQDYRIGLAEAEVHRALLDPLTHNMVGTPYVHFQGQVNAAPETRPQANGEGHVVLDIVSDLREFTRSNPAMRSMETRNRFHSGDNGLRYASEAGLWTVPWGEVRTGDKGK